MPKVPPAPPKPDLLQCVSPVSVGSVKVPSTQSTPTLQRFEQFARPSESEDLATLRAAFNPPTVKTSAPEVIARSSAWIGLSQHGEDLAVDSPVSVGDVGKAGSDIADSQASTRGSDSDQVSEASKDKETKPGLRADVAAFEPGMSAFGLTSARAREIALAAAEAADQQRWDTILAKLAKGEFIV
jgi:hypothetical protein